MENNGRLRQTPSIDRLSNLDQDVLGEILNRLPIIDAVRTSILSKEWRYAWSSISDLHFDEECRLDLCLGSRSSRLPGIVDHVLLLHNGPILSFRLSEFINFNSHVDKWILHFKRNGIERLCLEYKKRDGHICMVPSCLFSCEKLKVLVLRYYYCFALPPNFKGFAHLRSLVLNVECVIEDAIGKLVSLCPILEDFSLEYRNCPDCLSLSAPRLKSLQVFGRFKDIVLVGCSQLDTLAIHLDYKIIRSQYEYINVSKLETVLHCLPLLKNLTVELYFLRFLAVGTGLHELFHPLENLKVLNLNLHFKDFKEVSAAICLFKSSPNLENIKIRVPPDYDSIVEPYEWENVDTNLFCRLKKMSIEYEHDQYPEMEFVEFVLANSPVLEIISLEFAVESREEEFTIFNSLLSFKRASHSAQIRCSTPR